MDPASIVEMDPASIVEDTEWTPFCPQTDGQMDKVKPVYPLQLRWAGGILINCNALDADLS